MPALPKGSIDFHGPRAAVETADGLHAVRHALSGPEALIREAAALKRRIRSLQDRLNELETEIAAQASFKPGAKTGRLAAGGWCAVVQLKENITWDQDRLLQIRDHIGERRFGELFRAEYRPHNMKAVHAAMLDAELGEALRWAMTVKPGKPYVTYEEPDAETHLD